MGWSGFVVRPFGVRKLVGKDGAPLLNPDGIPYQVDYERVQRELISPAMIAAGIDGATTEIIIEAGNIREDMFQLLAHADIVIADVSLHNANVFYELGARHALRPKRTFMIRFSGDEVPFDIKTDRYLAYDRDNPGAAVAALTAALLATLADRDRIDSPIFNLLPALKAPDIKDLVPVPPAFREELAWALQNHRIGHLVLLGEEANALPWGAEGQRGVAAALFSLKAWPACRTAWEAVRTRLDRDLEADIKLVTVHQRLKNPAASDAAVDRALTDYPGMAPARRAEAQSLKGSNAKERWTAGWGRQSPAELGVIALHSDDLKQACEAYAAGFDADLNHHYSGINALAMARVLLELAQACPDEWLADYETDTDAQRALDLLKERVNDLAGAVQLSLRSGEKREVPGSEEARWVRCSQADALLLRKERTPRVVAGYRKALDGAPPFFFDAVNRQLAMLGRLGLFGDNIAALRPVIDGLEALSRSKAASQPPTAAPDKVLLFAGHLIDKPGRPAPRFPAAQEAIARQAIQQAIEQAQAGWPAGARVRGIAGGACGGDLVFHEVCAELGIATELYLVMPPAPYIAESVRVDPAIDSHPGWIERFHTVRQRCEAAGASHQLGNSAELPHWLSRLRGYSIWERNNRWMLQSALAFGADKLTLLALWDGQAGDDVGGTQHMVQVAEAAGAAVRHINSRTLFGMG